MLVLLLKKAGSFFSKAMNSTSTIKLLHRTSRAYTSVVKRQHLRSYSTKSIFREDAFKDQVVVVTGGSKGIGKAISINFANLGANVVGELQLKKYRKL